MDTASPGTALGKLQRGRGAGYLEALQRLDTAGDLLVECISEDPRAEPYFEARADYYARLAAAIEFDPKPLGPILGRDSGTMLAAETAGAMARRGDARAVELLMDYLPAGEHWGIAFRSLCDVKRRAPAAARLVEERYPDDKELFDQVYYDVPRCPQPWEAGIDPTSRMGRALSNSVERTKRVLDDDASAFMDLPTDELVRIVTQETRKKIVKVLAERTGAADRALMIEAGDGTYLEARLLCVEALAKQKAPEAFGIAERILRDPKTEKMAHISAAFALVDLPEELVLPAARRWFLESHAALRYAGETVISLCASPSDGPLLLTAVPEALANGDWDRLRDLLQGVARHPVGEEQPVLVEVFETAVASRCRTEAARAMSALPSFAKGFAHECLWDCESDTRYRGVEAVAEWSGGVRERLEEIAADRFEEEYLRSLARGRLEAV